MAKEKKKKDNLLGIQSLQTAPHLSGCPLRSWEKILVGAKVRWISDLILGMCQAWPYLKDTFLRV